MKMRILAMACAIVTLASGCSDRKAEEANFTGTWNSPQVGLMTLVQEGNHVTGKYDFQNGRLAGEVQGATLTFRWWQNVEPGAPYESAKLNERGDGYLLLTAGAGSFEGKWRFEGKANWHDDWFANRHQGE